MEDVKTILGEEIVEEIKILKDMKTGTEEYKTAVDGLAKLLDAWNDMEQKDIENKEKVESRKCENDIKLKQIDNDKKFQWFKLAVELTGIGASLFGVVWGVCKTFEFEKEGTVTTIMGRGLINKLIPKK